MSIYEKSIIKVSHIEESTNLLGPYADYSRLLNDVKRNEALLLQKNQELEQAIAAIRNDVSRRNKGSSQDAKEYLQTATSTFHVIEAKPHEKFMPKRLQIFFNAIKDGQQLFKAGLYEAATAVAISAKSGLERLGYSIDDKVEEWDKQFDLFTLKLSYLQNKIQQELADWEQHSEAGDSRQGQKGIPLLCCSGPVPCPGYGHERYRFCSR